MVELSLCHELRPEVCEQQADGSDVTKGQVCNTGYDHVPRTEDFAAADRVRYGKTTSVVFVDLEDSEHDYSKIHDNYEISCPSKEDQLQTNYDILRQADSTLSSVSPCTIPDFKEDAVASPSGDDVYCPVVCYNVSSHAGEKAKECELTEDGTDTCADQSMRAMFVFRRGSSKGIRAQMLCPGISLSENFTNTMGDLAATHDALEITQRDHSLPTVVFKTKPGGLQTPTLNVKLRLVYGPDNNGEIKTCGFADQSSQYSRSASPFKIRNIESYNTEAAPTIDDKEDYRMRSEVPTYVREGSETGKIELKFTIPFASRDESRVITNVEVSECPREETTADNSKSERIDVFDKDLWKNTTSSNYKHPFANFGSCSMLDLPSGVGTDPTNEDLFLPRNEGRL